ncbi:hypothetical protein C5Z26_01280 [Lactobacillus sp. CBA3606]|uniref:hypothetical protein n=1 Tax=Lactobacillus sp. CBA3606 TaxID=2099789 RepID=UPI000CFB7C01|nr:hypothetical protein [Lactobacillus sp. CBA3606]AVK62832.1 hypothetical protein C5Z26_01280 [Lactobacillus sp. CBA3606]
MNDILHQYKLNRAIVISLLIGLLIFAQLPLMTLASCGIAAAMMIRTWLTASKRTVKVGLSVIYGGVMVFQLTFNALVVFALRGVSPLYYPTKLVAVGLLLLPLVVERFMMVTQQTEFYLPTAEDVTAISFAELRRNRTRMQATLKQMAEMKQRISVAHLKTVITDLPRHRAATYINHGTLTAAYFTAAQATLADQNIYLVVSNTGSPASEIISSFTQKQYNHVSLAFDRELTTIISYNGGDNVYPPGMNAENLAFFHQKADASVLVYRLPVTTAAKQFMIDKITEINREGSAYNLVGLVAKHSFRPNIMFCSQFVYTMLKLAGVTYFDKAAGAVRPTDFIELDYYKQLKFEYEITF